MSARKGKKKEQYEVEAILDEKIVDKETLYLVHWKSFSKEEGTWEPEKNLIGAEEILKKWKAARTKKKRNIKEKIPITVPKRNLRSNSTIDLTIETKPPAKSKPAPKSNKLKQPEKPAIPTKPTTLTRKDSLKRQLSVESEDKPEAKKSKLNPSTAPKTRNLRSNAQEKDPQPEQIPVIQIILTPPKKGTNKKINNEKVAVGDEPEESSFSQFEETNQTGIKQRISKNVKQPKKGTKLKDEPIKALKQNTSSKDFGLHLSEDEDSEMTEEKKKELTVSQEIQADLIEATEHSHEKNKNNNFPESPSKNKKRKFLENEENPLHIQQRLMVQSWTSPVKRKLSTEFDEVKSIGNDCFSPIKIPPKK